MAITGTYYLESREEKKEKERNQGIKISRRKAQKVLHVVSEGVMGRATANHMDETPPPSGVCEVLTQFASGPGTLQFPRAVGIPHY